VKPGTLGPKFETTAFGDMGLQLLDPSESTGDTLW
jgi:hypothetical protein